MKNQEVRAILAVSILSVSLAMSACGNQTEVPVEPTIVTEQVTETVIPETVEEDLSSNSITIDGNLDTSVTGTFYAQSDTSVFKEATQASDVLSEITAGTGVDVLGIYGQTGMYQISFEDGVAYVDSSLFDVNVAVVDAESATELTDAEKQEAIANGTTSDATVTLTDEQLDAIVKEATQGTGGVSIPAGIGDVGDGSAPADGPALNLDNVDTSDSTITGDVLN